MARKLEIEIIGDASSLSRAFSKASSDTDAFGKSTGKLGSALGTLGKAAVVTAGAAGVGGLFAVLKTGIPEFAESSRVAAQTGAVLKSTGGAANVTAKEVSNLAGAIMAKTGVDDEAIQSGENMLLTFTNVRNEVGKGNDIFNQATGILTDMSVAMGTDMSKQAIQLGKALNDPIKGVSALSRVGVTFTDSQKAAIKAMVEAGNTAGAQKVILAELRKEFGGSAEAAGKTLPGQLNILKQSFNNLAGSIVGSLAPAFAGTLSGLNDFVRKLTEAQGIRAKLSIVWEGIENVAQDLVSKLWDAIAGKWVSIPYAGKQFQQGLFQILQDAFSQLDWSALAKQIGDAISSAVEKVDWPGIGAKIKAGMDKAPSQSDIQAWGNGVGDKMTSALNDAVNRLQNIDFSTIGSTIVKGLAKAVAGAVLFLVSSASIELEKAWLKAITLPSGIALGIATGVIRELATGIGRGVAFVYNAGHALGVKAMNGLESGARAGWEKVWNFISQIPGTIRNKFANAGTWLLGAGMAILDGLWNGLKQKGANVLAWAEKWKDRLKGIFTLHFGSTPFEVGTQVGADLVGGIGGGMDATSGEAAAKAAQVVVSIKTALGNFEGVGESMTAAMLGAVGGALSAAKALVESRKGEFDAAFGGLASGIASAFATVTGNIKTPAEKQLAGIEKANKEAQLLQAESDAGVLLANAKTNEEMLAAEAAYAAAEQAIQVYNLEQQAANERVQQNAINAVRTEALQTMLANLGTQLGAGTITYQQWHAGVMQVLSSFIPGWQQRGSELGQAVVNALGKKKTAAESAAAKLAQAHSVMGGYVDEFTAKGKKLGQAFATGLEEKLAEVRGAAKKLADAASINAKVTVSVSTGAAGGKVDGARAAGGPVWPGGVFLVGEEGPELFVPRRAGSIVPSSSTAAAAAGGGQTNVFVELNGFSGDARAVRELAERIRVEFQRNQGRNA